jgi:large subunit ribosomal protein L17
MKHRKTGRQFGRVRSQRKALMHSLLSSLLIHGRIETTEAKAKETKDAIDKIITKAKRATDSRMEIARKLSGVISQEAITALIGHMEKFDARVSGYARVIKLAPRKSDSAHVAVIELVDLTKKTAKKKETVTEKEQVKESAK